MSRLAVAIYVLGLLAEFGWRAWVVWHMGK